MPSKTEDAARGLEAELRYEFAWLERDLKKLRELGPLAATLAPAERLQADALEMLRGRRRARRLRSPPRRR